MPNSYLGIDIGGTKIAGAIVRDDGTVVYKEDIPTDAYQGGKHVLAASIALGRK